MVASPAVITSTAESKVFEMIEQMEELAGAGDWDQVEGIAARLRHAVMEVAEADRRAVILAVQRSTEKVAAGAIMTRQTVSEKMSELRRGQAAKKAYELR